MPQLATLIGSGERRAAATEGARRLTPLRFFLRYPIFLLAFGPPQFKGTVVGVDTSQAHFDIWNLIQVCWIAAIACRAMMRMATMERLAVVKPVRSILKYAFLLGLLFLFSVAYSPGKVISLEFLTLFSLNFICLFEFVVDVYRHPPDWMNCIFQLRLIALLLVATVFVTLPIAPDLVMRVTQGSIGLRLSGGTIGEMAFLCPTVAIISAHTFFLSLEPKWRAVTFLGVGVAGTFLAQSRGSEIALFLILVVQAVKWGRRRRGAAQVVIAASLVAAMLAALVMTAVGFDQLWDSFNRNQSLDEIVSGSGRTGVWQGLVEYCLSHPQGLGYISGIRHVTLGVAAADLHRSLNSQGGTDNSYLEVLADAGWLALALYLGWLGKIAALGWRVHHDAERRSGVRSSGAARALPCALSLLTFYLMEGMESSDFVVPMMCAFYLQATVIAILLGASTSALLAGRRDACYPIAN